MNEKKKIRIGQWVLTTVLGLYALICLVPIILIVIVSFSSTESINNKGFSFFPEGWSLKGWEYVLSFGDQIVQSYGVTIFVTVVGTGLGLIVMSMFAYALSRSNYILRTPLNVMMIFTMLFSGGQLANYIVQTTMYGLKDSIWALILPGVGCMNIIIMRSYIKGTITEALMESAKIDGAGEFRIYLQIVFPLMKPTLAAIGFRQAVNYWNNWMRGYLYITDPKKTPLQVLLIRIEKNIDYILNNASEISAQEYADAIANMPQEPARMAILLTVLGPIMIAYPFFQKYFVKGMTVGAVKG